MLKREDSKVDLKDAFQQIPVHPDDIPKTTITTPFGAFQYNYMPFGLSASQSFQRFIDSALHNITITLPNGEEKEVSVFADIDDILLASSNHAIITCSGRSAKGVKDVKGGGEVRKVLCESAD